MSDLTAKKRKIIHIDMDCFFAAVEIRDNPALKGRPVGVGGSAEGRGVLATASYEARKFGARSAMPTSHALRLCPDLILVPPHFSKYKIESHKIHKIFHKFTDKIQPLSLDEAYLDVSEHENATKTALEIRRQIYKETQLTASAGIAPNKFLAKIASDWKKPNGQFTVAPKMIDDFVQKLSVKKIPGVGKVTEKKMHHLGIKTCGDLQKWSVEELSHTFGVWGLRLYDICRGIDNRDVSNEGERKSLSVENTYAKDLVNAEECLKRLPKLFEEFQQRFERAQVHNKVKSLFVKVKFYDFKQTTFEQCKNLRVSFETYSQMIEDAFYRENKPVRLLGLGVRLKSVRKQQQTAQMKFF